MGARLRELLTQHCCCFSINQYDAGRVGPPYKIKLRTGTPYKGYIPRRSPAAIAAIQREVEKMKKANFIETSISPYLTPMVCVPKPDRNIWVCIDFRRVNLDVVNDAYTIHWIEDHLNAMTDATVFLTLDLTKGYHQLLIDEESREVTAFSTPEGLFQWKVLPLGMKTLGAVFQRVMDTIFEGLQPLKVVVYIDNITVFSPTMEQHIINLDHMFRRLAKANLKASFTKCVLVQSKVKVLGHLVSAEGIKLNLDKVKAIAQMKPPTDASGVRLFMGSIIFYG